MIATCSTVCVAFNEPAVMSRFISYFSQPPILIHSNPTGAQTIGTIKNNRKLQLLTSEWQKFKTDSGSVMCYPVFVWYVQLHIKTKC